MATDNYDTEPYIKAIEDYRDALVAALKICNDPFKAPEIQVATAHDVQQAAWNMQVEYSAMLRSHKNA